MNDLQVCWWPIDKPMPYARTSRKIPERAIDKVAASIKGFGFRQCIVVDKATSFHSRIAKRGRDGRFSAVVD